MIEFKQIIGFLFFLIALYLCIIYYDIELFAIITLLIFSEKLNN